MAIITFSTLLHKLPTQNWTECIFRGKSQHLNNVFNLIKRLFSFVI